MDGLAILHLLAGIVVHLLRAAVADEHPGSLKLAEDSHCVYRGNEDCGCECDREEMCMSACGGCARD